MLNHSAGGAGAPDTRRAERLYERVLGEYGDDSVAQLGGAHVACEQASNILTKVLEWGRLAAYLEQSTRYIYYDRKLGGRYRYLVPPEIRGSDHEGRYREEMDRQFETYSSIVRRLTDYFAARFPRAAGDSARVEIDHSGEGLRYSAWAAPCRDLVECRHIRDRSGVRIAAAAYARKPLAEVRDYSALLLDELRTVIPAFVRRVDVPDRGGAWSDYLRRTADSMEGIARELEVVAPRDVPEVELTDWDPDAETKVAAAALYAFTDLPDGQLLELAEKMPYEEKARVIRAYAGERLNRRHKPGRGAERVSYRFDILSDFGSFRDLAAPPYAHTRMATVGRIARILHSAGHRRGARIGRMARSDGPHGQPSLRPPPGSWHERGTVCRAVFLSTALRHAAKRPGSLPPA